MLLRGARVVPLPGEPGRVSEPGGSPVDLRVADGHITEIAPRLDAGRGEEVVDLDGRWVLPGLWDAHVHLDQWALARRRLDVSGTTSAGEVTARVVEHLRGRDLAGSDPDEVLVAMGFRDSLWPEAPTARLLDDALAAAGLPPTPVVVICGDLHSAWLSTPALRRWAGDGGSDGVLREDEWFAVLRALQDVPGEVVDRWAGEAAAAAAARGVVGVVDFELADNLTVWRRRVAAGQRSLRVVAGIWREHLDGVLARELATGDAVPGTDGLVRVGPLKVISDGSLNTRTALCHDPYPGNETAPYGVLNVGPDELVPLMAHAARHGVACAIHAIGDRANALALDAFAASGARGSIEHAQLLVDDDVARFAALDVTASVQPEHALDDRDVADLLWAGRTARAFPLRALHDAGVRLALGSDAPVAPLDPWLAVGAAVDRTRDGREPWHPEQCLPADVALAASVRSRVAVGQRADLVVVDRDPLTTRGEALRHMPVAATLRAPLWTHKAL